LHVPRVLIHLMLLTVRYLFLLADEFIRLRTALRVRGFRNRADLHSWRTIGQVAGTLLVRGHDRAERVHQAMRCRGFNGSFQCLHAFQARAVDVVLGAMVLAAAVAVLAWDIGLAQG
jgi:cobalt/nickel transport system permease protein